MKTFNLKEVFSDYGWNKGFKFEINFSRQSVARIYISDRKTKYYAGGYGYDKESSVIALMINDLIGARPYNENIYGNRNGFLSGGVGFWSIKDSFESLGDGFTLNKIYCGKYSDVYNITFNLGGGAA